MNAVLCVGNKDHRATCTCELCKVSVKHDRRCAALPTHVTQYAAHVWVNKWEPAITDGARNCESYVVLLNSMGNSACEVNIRGNRRLSYSIQNLMKYDPILSLAISISIFPFIKYYHHLYQYFN